MTKYRIRWRHIWRNWLPVVFLVRELMDNWKPVRRATMAAVEDDPDVADFIAAGDQLYRILVERRRR